MDRIEREKKTVAMMIAVYCRRHHGALGTDLCADCAGLLEYAHIRLDHCPKGNAKGSCRRCEIHCYAPDKRAKIRDVMRYVGPRMLFISPLQAIRHLISELR